MVYQEIKSVKENAFSANEEYKKYRDKWNQNPKNLVVEDFPIHLDFELTTYCNLSCPEKICSLRCPYSLPHGEILPKQNLSFEIFKKAIDEGVGKGLCSIKLSYRGEPTLHPDIIDFIRYAKEKGVLEVLLNTNAFSLNAGLIEDLIDSGLDKILCSVVASDEKVFNNIRGDDVFTSVFENIQNLMKLKEKKNSSKPIVVVQLFENYTSQTKKWENLVDNVAVDSLGEFILKNKSNVGQTEFNCPYIYRRLFILYNGDVMMCCGDHNDNDCLGNIKNDDIESIWKGERLSTVRKLHKNGRSGEIEICSKCGFRKTYLTKMQGEKI